MMKPYLLFIAIALCSLTVRAQENMLSLSGGYVFTNLEETDENASGFRVNGIFEFNPMGGKLVHGFSVGYIHATATKTVAEQTTDYTLSNWPIYYAPKFLIGNNSFKGFIKGALGVHFSGYKREGALGDNDSWDIGFYGGAGAGLMKDFGEKMFINLEYEWAYLSNASYRDGFINSVSAGIGLRF